MRNYIGVVVLVCGVSACRQAQPEPAGQTASRAAEATAESTEVDLRFDGGYAFVHRPAADAKLSVAAIKAHHGSGLHTMRMHVREGVVQTPDVVEAPSQPGDQIWDLDKFDYDIRPLGGPSSLSLPSAKPVPAACGEVPDGLADNINLLPNISQIVVANGESAILNSDRKLLGNQVVLTGGTLMLLRASSCFEYEFGTSRVEHRFPAGLSAVSVRFRIQGKDFSLKFTPMVNGVPNEAGAKTFLVRANRDNKVQIAFGRPPCENCTLALRAPLDDFERFYSLFTTRPSKRPLPKKIAHRDVRSPGDECPPGWYEDPPPAAPANVRR